MQDIHVKQCLSVFRFYRKEKTRNKKKNRKHIIRKILRRIEWMIIGVYIKKKKKKIKMKQKRRIEETTKER